MVELPQLRHRVLADRHEAEHIVIVEFDIRVGILAAVGNGSLATHATCLRITHSSAKLLGFNHMLETRYALLIVSTAYLWADADEALQPDHPRRLGSTSSE